MRFRTLSDSLGLIILLFSLSFIVPILTGWAYEETRRDLLLTFGLPMAIAVVLGILLRYVGRGDSETLRDREAFAAMGLAWLMMAALGALPYVLGGFLSSYVDAFFESMSGITTTGATLLTPSDGDFLDHYSHSIMIWRSLTQYIGGMGIVVVSVVVLSSLLQGGMSLVRSGMPGHTVTRLKPRIAHTAREIWKIFALLSLLEVFLLWVVLTALGETDPLFDAVNHTFTTLSTGGFSTHVTSISHFDSILVEGIVAIFMLLAGINFVLYYHFSRGDVSMLSQDPEFRFYLILMAFGVVFVAANLMIKNVYGPGASFRQAFFQVISIQTTTGFATADFAGWPSSIQFFFLMLMFIGGCAGSAAGGIKMVRMLILFKLVRREVRYVIHPGSVMPIRLGGAIVSERMVRTITIFFFVFMSIFAISTVILCFFGLDLMSSGSATMACLFNVGPAMGDLGPAGNYSMVHPLGKAWLSVLMWIGRLEIFAPLMLLFPTTWKK